MHIGSLLSRHARTRPDHLAVVFQQQRLTWRELHQRVNRLANALLALGIRKGDKIATLLPNTLELLDIYWAAACTGAVVVPLSPLLRGRGITSLLNDSDTVLVFTHQPFVEHLEPLRAELPAIAPDRYVLVDAQGVPGYRSYEELTAAASDRAPEAPALSGGDPYNIIYSSGTTGLPKGIVHTHAVRAAYCTLFASDWRMRPESVVMHAGSIVFNGAFLTLMPWMYLGATYVLLDHFEPELALRTLQQERVTHTFMVPSQLIAMMGLPGFTPQALPALEMLGTVGAPFHKEHREELNHRLPGVFHELYGLTEGFVTVLDKTHYARKPTSVGTPPAFFEMRIVGENGRELPPGEVGEILGRGPILMSGYYKRPDLTAQAIVDGWLRTGDMGYADADGFLYLVDRMKDLIISGGVNVYPRDIEELLVQHPAVREAAVFGVPDEKWGEAPLAAVLLRQPGAVTAEALRQWINSRVEARYQQVREVVIREEFPRNTAGKTLKRVMRDEYWQSRGEKI
jgi:long-chain acyl-CoA synthetase